MNCISKTRHSSSKTFNFLSSITNTIYALLTLNVFAGFLGCWVGEVLASTVEARYPLTHPPFSAYNYHCLKLSLKMKKDDIHV